ncbi:MAG: tRNA dihydrouridine(20/20a) synthase DusA [Hyphomicrobiaceae bacterium]|nr:MAG: tRNA dihydrouridine(20/20a) synthase DusA [Hyphomicrobiaceae bacterium]
MHCLGPSIEFRRFGAREDVLQTTTLSARHRFSVAPMMDWSDRHCRSFHRILTRGALLYTEMVTARAVLHGDRERLLGYSPAEHPIALQLGGADPGELARAAEIGADFGYDEINLNVGCPSDRVQEGRFGACLMAEPSLVAKAVSKMAAAVGVPVTVKCRIGIDDQDSDADLDRFIEEIAAAGCRTFIVHARKAWLSGLSPKDNREIPPLDYARVFRLKKRRPGLRIVLNGGITSLVEAARHLEHVDGVMLGRAAYQNPYLLAAVDRRFFADAAPPLSRAEVINSYVAYVEARLAEGVPLNAMLRHVLGLYHGEPGGRRFRRHIAENVARAGAGAEVLREAAAIAEGWRGRLHLAAAE